MKTKTLNLTLGMTPKVRAQALTLEVIYQRRPSKNWLFAPCPTSFVWKTPPVPGRPDHIAQKTSETQHILRSGRLWTGRVGVSSEFETQNICTTFSGIDVLLRGQPPSRSRSSTFGWPPPPSYKTSLMDGPFNAMVSRWYRSPAWP